MELVPTQDEEALRSKLLQARERLDCLVRDLHTIDGELEALAIERQRYDLLRTACSALDELSGLDGAGLFWDGFPAGSEGDAHVRLVWGRVEAFQKLLSEVEDRRAAVIEEIHQQEETAEIFEDAVFELERRKEQRKLEWIVEREISSLPDRRSIMPWSRGGEEDDRLRKFLAIALLLSLFFGLVFPLIPLPVPERGQPVVVPERLASLIREERKLPPPPPPKQKETKPDKSKPEPTKPEVAEKSTSHKATQHAAKSKGLLAFREQFSGLAQHNLSARLGAQARISGSGEAGRIGRPQRNMVATRAAGSSGGINLSSLSRGVGGGGGDQIKGVQIARATSSIGSLTGDDRPLSDGPSLSRTDEEIQIVFDRHKAALYRLYNRELRKDPTLKGQMVLRITIEPDGSVSLCKLQSSDMDAPQLAAQVVERVKTFDFGAKEGIPAITILYPIDFLPAT